MTIYLYIKQHSVTGLKYFGMTRQRNPFSYKGSGLHWLRHLKNHRNLIETLEVWGFDNQDLCTEFALSFSKNNNIVESKEWANLREENALDGWVIGMRHSEETKGKMRGRICSDETRAKLSVVSKNQSAETRAKIGAARRGKICSDETRAKLSLAFKGKPCSEETKAKIRLTKKLSKSLTRPF